MSSINQSAMTEESQCRVTVQEWDSKRVTAEGDVQDDS